METLKQRIDKLESQGYTARFAIDPDKQCLTINKKPIALSNVQVDNYYRIEADSDANNQSLVIALQTAGGGQKGLLVDTHGIHANAEVAEVVTQLLKKCTPH